MTSYDRGAFVDGKMLHIIPCANGTYAIEREDIERVRQGRQPEMIAFSSAGDMLKFLQSEYGFERADGGKAENPEAPWPSTESEDVIPAVIGTACEAAWDKIRKPGGKFWHELDGDMRALAMACFMAGAEI